MKQKFERKTTVECVGILDKNPDNEFFISVEGKEDTEVYKMSDLLEEMLGCEISLKLNEYRD